MTKVIAPKNKEDSFAVLKETFFSYYQSFQSTNYYGLYS